MGSTALNRQRSVKFHIDDSSAKPSIKITVSSDALAETVLKNNVSLSSTPIMDKDDDSSNNVTGMSQQQSALIQIVGNCCSNAGGGGDGGSNTPSNGVLCNCANGDDKRTRIALDDFTVLEFPNCIDFGIKDFLCCKDEIELDLSSDTDASYLDATPPHRFSDSELDNQIEAMSITLDTQLNPFANRGFLLKSGMDPDDDDEDDDEETTEESFIMDEEEASSSASNSAATICGTGEGNGIAELEQDHISLSSSSEVSIQGESHIALIDGEDDGTPQSINQTNETERTQPITISDDDNDENSTPVERRVLDVCLEKENVECGDGSTANIKTMLPNSVQQESDEENLTTAAELENAQDGEGKNKHPTSPTTKITGDILQREVPKKSQPISRKIVQHPTKHFKRQISLPASIFMSYLLEQNNKANYYKQPSSDAKMNNQNEEHRNQPNCDIIVKNKLNRSNSCSKKSTKPCNNIMRPPLSKIDSYRSTKVIHGSTEDYEYDDINISRSFNETKSECADEIGMTELECGDDDNLNLLDCANDKSQWSCGSKSDSFTESDEAQDEEMDDEQQAFTSEVEKKSLILRHVRRLIRQDTTGNFAPPDFSI